MDPAKHVYLVIPAAGIGSRMAAKTAKQYLKIQDKSILEHTIDIFIDHPLILKIVVVIHPEDSIFEHLNISSHTKVVTVVGGAERADSVQAGLEFLIQHNADINKYVLVHDAARPCLSLDDLNKLLLSQTHLSAENHCVGAILATPVSDTIKRAQPLQDHPVIDQTLDREGLWLAQTPQMFKLGELLMAIKDSRTQGLITDEASAVEISGKQVLLVEGQSSNIKVTRPADLGLAEFYLTTRDT